MLWSLFKILLFVAAIAGLTYGAAYLLESEGGVMITVAGVEYTLGPLQAVIALLVLVGLVWAALKLTTFLVATLKFLNGDDTAISRYFDRNREKKGYVALSEGLMALASGEGRLAMDKARKAERYLRKPELTNLLTAQAAEMSGDKRRATEVYKQLLATDSTRFVGVRGLMKQKLEEGQTETALKLAQTAFALKPRHVETQDVLLKLQAETGDWAGARKTLNAKLRHGSLPRDVHRRRDAVLALSEATDIVEEGNSIEAREASIEANRLSPDLIPAAVMAAQSYIDQGKSRYATRVVKKAWDAQPHPDLAAVFAAIVPDETPAARIKRFRALTKNSAEHAETKMVMAELNIAAEDFPEARRALGKVYETEPTTRSLTIMAAVEQGEGASEAVVKGWLARAVTAPRGPQWVCNNCHNIHASWEPVCENCQSFDTLEWVAPPTSEIASPTGVEMLPLIVGAIDDKTDSDAEAESEPLDAEVIDVPSEDTSASASSAQDTSESATGPAPGMVR